MRRYVVAWLIGWTLAFQASAQTCEPGPDTDCDGDGYTPAMGDCDDLDPEAHPGLREVCYDGIDNNCDGFVDEECEVAALEGGIGGGGGCTAEGAIGSVVLLLPLLALRPRRSRRERTP